MRWYNKVALGAGALAAFLYTGMRLEKSTRENPFATTQITGDQANFYAGAFGEFDFVDLDTDNNGAADLYCILFERGHAFCRTNGRTYNRVGKGAPEAKALEKARPGYILAEPRQ